MCDPVPPASHFRGCHVHSLGRRYAGSSAWCVPRLVLLFMFVAGCETPGFSNLRAGWAPPPGAKFRIGQVSDVADKSKRKDVGNFDVAGEIRDRLGEALKKEGLSAGSDSQGPVLVLEPTILDYDPGSAFGRWLWPGVGSTVLAVECRILDNGQDVGRVSSFRKIESGGLSSVGQWRIVFQTVASDITQQLKKILRPKQV